MRALAAIIAWNLRTERVRLATLSAAAATFMGLLVAISDAVEPAEFQEVLDRLPRALTSLIGGAAGGLFTVDRWLAIAHNHPIWLLLVLSFPIASVLSALGRGIEDGTLEILLAQPISRTKWYLALAASTAIGTVAVLTASAAGGILAGRLFDLPHEIRTSIVVEMSLSGAALALVAGGLSLLAAAATGGRGRPGAWVLGALVASYFLEYLSRVWSPLEGAAFLSVFHHHDPMRIVDEGLAGPPVAILAGVALALGAAGLVVFRRRQLTF